MKSERVLRFVLGRKRPVTAAVVASQFAIETSTASKYLRDLYDAGQVTREQFGNHVIWSAVKGIKAPIEPVEIETPVEVKEEIEEQVEPQTVATFRWPSSYPHVRGYDD